MSVSAAKNQEEISAVVERIRALGTFTGWDGKTVYTISDIKPYTVPGNAPAAKGELAVWLQTPAAKRPHIIFPQLVLAAMRFTSNPKSRGKFTSFVPARFAARMMDARSPFRKFPRLYEHAGIYLALAKIMLGLPADWQDATTVAHHERWDEEHRLRHPNVRTIDGLMQDMLQAYAEAVENGPLPMTAAPGDDLAERACTAARRRHGSMAQVAEYEGLRTDVIDLWGHARNDPLHADIAGSPVLMFSLLYLNVLFWMKRIRGSAVTSVVNRLADAHDAGELQRIVDGIDLEVASSKKEKEAAFRRIIAMKHLR